MSSLSNYSPSSPINEKLTEKIQVLLTKSDLKDLFRLIMIKSMEELDKPVSLSQYLRDLITSHIGKKRENIIDYVNTTNGQKSLVVEKVNNIIEDHEIDKKINENKNK